MMINLPNRLKLVLLFSWFLSFSVFCQTKKVLNYQIVDDKTLHFGFCIGFNSMDFSYDRNSHAKDDSLYMDTYLPSPGFNVSIVSELRISDQLAIRCLPGLVFGQRIVSVTDTYDQSDPDHYVKDLGKIEVESNYIDIPVLIKYKAKRLNNFRPYLIGGTSLRYDMASQKDNSLKIRDGDGGKLMINIKPFDYFAEVGVGFDFYLKYFKFSTELKLSQGLRSVLDRNLSPAGLDNLSSNILLLNFHFE